MASVAKSNADAVREFAAAWNRDDWDEMEAAFWPDAQAIAPRGWPEAESPRGWEAVRRQFERLKDPWEEEHFELESVEELDAQRALSHGRWLGSGHDGIPLDLEFWIVSRYRDGRIESVAFYFDRDEALRGAG